MPSAEFLQAKEVIMTLASLVPQRNRDEANSDVFIVNMGKSFCQNLLIFDAMSKADSRSEEKSYMPDRFRH